MLCKLYYEFEGANINMVIQKNSFPYSKIRLNIWRTFYSKLRYETMLDFILKGGEDYMIKIVRRELSGAIKKEKDIDMINDKKEKVLRLHSIIQLDEEDWKILKKKSL